MTEPCTASLFAWGDPSIAYIATHLRQPWLTPFMYLITQLGKIEVVILIGSLLYWIWNKRYSKYLAYGMFVTVFLNLGIKDWVMECRPAAEYWLDSARGYSFPSGHAQGGILLWWGLAYYVRSRMLSLLCVIIGILIVLSRPYLGVHYPADALVGAVLGFVTLVGCIFCEKKNIDPLQRFSLPIQSLILVVMLALLQIFVIDRSHISIVAIGISFGFWLGCQLEAKQLHFVNPDHILKLIGQVFIGAIGLWLFVLQLDHWLKHLQPAIAQPLQYAQFFMVGIWITYAAPWVALKLRLIKSN